MNNESINGTSSEDSVFITETPVTSDVLAKLRRLKIQESIISASLEKHNSEEDNHLTGDSNYKLDWKSYSAKIKNNIIEIKNMFEDIKIATTDSKDNLKNINIEEIKRDILNLNTKIKSLEDFISTELKLLKSEEMELIKQMNGEPKREINTKGKVKIQTKQYNEVVPSPIRVLINSPLKCNEVQQFQDFMSKSKNRYGGWNEYNHNIFVQIWNKFYATDDVAIQENIKNEIGHSKLLPQFKDEVYERITGIQLDEIISHSKWYSEFCYLKRAQQSALEKWRDNKRKIKGRQEKVKNNKNDIQSPNYDNLCRKQNETSKYQKPIFNGLQNHEFERNQSSLESNPASEIDFQIHDELFGVPCTIAKSPEQIQTKNKPDPKRKLSTFASPTEQWINRCNDNDNSGHTFRNADIENVDKLCIPNWRLRLHN